MKDITIEEKGRAKINLALHVTGVRADGYHVLDSIVIFTDISDSLVIKKDSKIEIKLNFVKIGSPDNKIFLNP